MDRSGWAEFFAVIVIAIVATILIVYGVVEFMEWGCP